jgi:thiamine biosynthesis lipoprotein
MKIYIVAALILLVGIAAAWIIVDNVISGMSDLGSPYRIPKGRYDCFLITDGPMFHTDDFPATRIAHGSFPPFPIPVYDEKRELMGVKFHIGVYDREKTSARIAVTEAFRRIEMIDERVDPEKEGSEVSKINREAGARPVVMSQELHFIVSRAMEISKRSGGAFDITSGPLRRLWERYGAAGQVPPEEEISAAVALVGYKSVQIDDRKRTIRLTRKGACLDLHGIAVGFALDQAAYVLRSQGVLKGFVRTDDSCHLIRPPEEPSFVLGIPDGRGLLKFIYENDRPAAATKGLCRGYKFVGNVIISGIVDPRSGTCAGNVASCTVTGPDAMTCEAMAAAITVMGGVKVNVFLGQFNPAK